MADILLAALKERAHSMQDYDAPRVEVLGDTNEITLSEGSLQNSL